MKLLQLLFIATLIIFASCKQQPAKEYCVKLDWNCEKDKDYVLVKVLDSNSLMLDAYGQKLKKDKWYIYCTKPKTLVPYQFHSPSTDPNVFQSSDFYNAEIHKYIRGNAVQLDTVRINSPVFDLEKQLTIEVVLLGDRYVELVNNGTGLFIYPRQTAVASK